MRLPIIFAAAVFAVGLSAQEKPDVPEAVVIPVKTLSGDSFGRLASLLGVFGAKFRADDRLRTIVIYAPGDVVAQMRKVIEQLDRPGSEAAIGHNIEMTLAYLRCSTTAQPDAPPLPPDLEAAARQLRAVTQYKNIQLWDIVPVHVQEGRDTDQSFRLPFVLPDLPNISATAQVRIVPEAVITRDGARYVRFRQIKIGFKIPQNMASTPNLSLNYIDVGLSTAGDFKEGQKTVLGKISGIDNESAIFVVISLKILD